MTRASLGVTFDKGCYASVQDLVITLSSMVEGIRQRASLTEI